MNEKMTDEKFCVAVMDGLIDTIQTKILDEGSESGLAPPALAMAVLACLGRTTNLVLKQISEEMHPSLAEDCRKKCAEYILNGK